MDASIATLSKAGAYTRFAFNGKVISFLHGKDLERYLTVKEWKDGYLVVDCLGRVKGRYEDYIDMPYILEMLYMNPEEYLKGLKGVAVSDV